MTKNVIQTCIIGRLKSDLLECRNELCLRCGAYKEKHKGACDGCKWRDTEELLRTTEAAENMRSVVHGKWTLNEDGSGTCSVCGRVQKNCWDLDNWDNFCHHCGADMK